MLIEREFLAKCICWHGSYQKLPKKYVDRTLKMLRVHSQDFQQWREMKNGCSVLTCINILSLSLCLTLVSAYFKLLLKWEFLYIEMPVLLHSAHYFVPFNSFRPPALWSPWMSSYIPSALPEGLSCCNSLNQGWLLLCSRYLCQLNVQMGKVSHGQPDQQIDVYLPDGHPDHHQHLQLWEGQRTTGLSPFGRRPQ